MSEGHDEYSHPIPDAGRVLNCQKPNPHPNLLTGIIPKPMPQESIVYFRENFEAINQVAKSQRVAIAFPDAAPGESPSSRTFQCSGGTEFQLHLRQSCNV